MERNARKSAAWAIKDENRDVWAWTDIDADTKLIEAFDVGGRSGEDANFWRECRQKQTLTTRYRQSA